MKLYVFFNMLEILERLCRSVGNDLFDLLVMEISGRGDINAKDKDDAGGRKSYLNGLFGSKK